MTSSLDRPKVTVIAAMTRDGGLGRAGQLLYHISDDLKHFKRVTMGKPIIMGRRTFESFPNGALPGRRNIVVTTRADYSASGIMTAGSVEEALRLASDCEEAMVIGGGEIYRQMMPLATSLELTVIDADAPEGTDTFMPAIDPSQWSEESASEPAVDPRTGVSYRFITLRRK
ncbi:MAG: dihydrofolate reductase [Muribaculum sp.]|nr:dihydrofolate reductase [Muribaculum sp.]